MVVLNFRVMEGVVESLISVVYLRYKVCYSLLNANLMSRISAVLYDLICQNFCNLNITIKLVNTYESKYSFIVC